MEGVDGGGGFICSRKAESAEVANPDRSAIWERICCGQQRREENPAEGEASMDRNSSIRLYPVVLRAPLASQSFPKHHTKLVNGAGWD
jgi:hypothetical protein